ncbi:hypothetical protein PN36_07000 [Candidatus Thiomargarita nelsonii]|uniref:Uncharacterized protein n=1 Tax=Candidatus Thiomargarita nelsonii TaxID=1003181 RepID=A0A0A6RNZ5_9GAMM|nr:hypothetical protein PN36_07000 [Candidatus Thiomargarita nelsonii]
MNKIKEMEQIEDILRPITKSWSSNYLRILFVFIYCSHWIFLILLCIFVVTVTLQFGHFPWYGHPDPKYAGAISILHTPIMLFMVWGVNTTPIVIILTGIRLWKKSIGWQEIGLYFGGLILFLFILFNDVAGLMTWLGD